MSEPELVQGVVIGGTGGVWRVRTSDGQTVDASLRGRLKKSEAGRRSDGSLRRDTVRSAATTLKLAVGDDVQLERSDSGDAWAIGEILPRRSVLARRTPGGGQGERIVAANVDQVVVMFAAAKPEPHLRMLDRFLVIAEGNGIPAQIIINKVDLVGEAATREKFQIYERAGYPVHLTSVRQESGLQSVRAMLAVLRIVHEIELTAGLMRNVARATRRLYPRELPPRIRGLIERMGAQAKIGRAHV